MVYLACSYVYRCVSCYSDCLVQYDIYIAMGTAMKFEVQLPAGDCDCEETD